jgi:hypothetical protein
LALESYVKNFANMACKTVSGSFFASGVQINVIAAGGGSSPSVDIGGGITHKPTFDIVG